jgi:hypothetical protein
MMAECSRIACVADHRVVYFAPVDLSNTASFAARTPAVHLARIPVDCANDVVNIAPKTIAQCPGAAGELRTGHGRSFGRGAASPVQSRAAIARPRACQAAPPAMAGKGVGFSTATCR